MQEKEMMGDALSSLNALITMLNYDIMHCNDKMLKDTFVSYRNQMEDIHWQLYVLCRDNGYYIPAAPAGMADVDAVKTAISN